MKLDVRSDRWFADCLPELGIQYFYQDKRKGFIVEKKVIDDKEVLLTCNPVSYDFPHTVDVRAYDGIELEVRLCGELPVWLEIALFPLQSGRPEFIQSTKAEVFVAPGERLVRVPFCAFDSSLLVSAYRKYISSMEIKLKKEEGAFQVKSLRFAKFGSFHVETETTSGAADVGMDIIYQVILENQRENSCYVGVAPVWKGRESIPFTYPKSVVLKPHERRIVEVCAKIPANIPCGGYETLTLEWIPDGDGAESRRTTFYAARKIRHPYLLHKEEGWQRLRSQLEKDSGLAKRWEKEYVEAAKAWKVPKPSEGKAFVYESVSQDDFLRAGIAWKVSQSQELLDKVISYLKGFLEEEKGYLGTEFSYFQAIESLHEYDKGHFPVHHACSAGWVQEGEFMSKIAAVYDLVYDRPEVTPLMHAQMERCMRNYMEFEDWRLTDGDGNNFQICEAAAALNFACLLQDYPMIGRFLAGCNGLYELMGSVFSDDGSYFEGASNYMCLAAELFLKSAIACENYGLNLKDVVVPASFDPYVVHAPWAVRKSADPSAKPFLGMSFERMGNSRKPYRRLKDYLDNLLHLATPEGILFSANDGNERSLVPFMEMAYYLYRDPAYLKIASLAEENDLLYGKHMWESQEFEPGKESYLNTGNGFGVLREKGENAVQAVLKFGQHGGYHGHYDRLSLLSYLKNNQTFHNLEFTWYGYASFLFKMWVHTSLAHNMVVVDKKMQEPTECQCIYFEDNEKFQAVCAQTVSRWSDPPYGGQTPYLQKFPEEKCRKEGRFILPGKPRSQGDIGEYSEPVFQRRLLVLAEGCCYIWDYEEADQDHVYDCLYHPLGRVSAEGLHFLKRTARLEEDPYGAGQFILNCYWYDQEGTAHFRFENEQKRFNHNDILDFAARTQLFGVYPQKQTVVVGRYPQKTDTFQNVEEISSKELWKDPCRKTVGFQQKGRCARFVTALEIGEKEGVLQKITSDSYESITILRKDGGVRRLKVYGMDQREENKISVQYEIL